MHSRQHGPFFVLVDPTAADIATAAATTHVHGEPTDFTLTPSWIIVILFLAVTLVATYLSVMNSVGALPLSTFLQLLAASRPQQLTDGERVDLWAVRIALWRATIPDVCASVSSLPGYVNCGAFSSPSHRLIDYFVHAYVIWIAPEPMPFSVYERLARRRIPDDVADLEAMEDVELNDWLQDMRSREAVATIRARPRVSVA